MRSKTWQGMVVSLLLAGCAGSFTQVSVDPAGKFPVSAGGVQVTGVHLTDAKELKVAQVHLRNPGGSVVVWVRANWYDAQGVHVEDPKETQREVFLAGGEEKTVTFTAPVPEAKIPRVQVRKGKK